MNSEELEQSLRTEFESYLKDVVAEIRQGVSDFQEKINADFDKQKEQLAESLRELDQKVGSDKELEVSFTESVAEHLKLARDEGASITAAAIAEAEKLDTPEERPPDFYNLSKAIDDISSKDSQSEILKALVKYAAEFTPRGAFFIVKNEHLVGWRVFGREDHEDPKAVREVFFPVSTGTALSSSVETLSTISEVGPESEDNVMYRDKLGFNNPDRMYAVPLIARGRGVAVLYADSGNKGDTVNIAAIEVLMRVAGLTVEVLASSPQVSRAKESHAKAVEYSESEDHSTDQDSSSTQSIPAPADYSGSSYPSSLDTSDSGFASEYQSSEAVAVEEAVETEEADSYEYEPVAAEAEFEPVAETAETAFEEPVVESPANLYEEAAEEQPAASESSFETSDFSSETPASEYEQTEFDAGQVETVEEDSWATSDVSEASEVETAEVETAEVETAEEESWATPDTSTEIDESYSADETYSADESFSPDDSYSTHESFSPDVSFSSESEAVEEPVPTFEAFDSGIEEPYSEPVVEAPETYEFESETEDPSFDESAESPGVEDAQDDTESFESESDESEYSFDQPIEAPVDSEPAVEFEQAEEIPAEEAPVEEVAAPPVRSRFADRNLDLPIEVSEDERRLHNDARRFARLLVSEIKLYNEQKVKEGRESSDLYERLREAIDRSREMYDKRVQPPVAAKFDYFNYELVNTLAEGDEGKLGGSYPGAAV